MAVMRDGDIRLPKAEQREPCEAFQVGLCPVLTGRALFSASFANYHTCVVQGAAALVADDDNDVRHLNTRVLERMGMSVVSCADGREAFQAVTDGQGNLSVAVLDVAMPGMTGFEVCRAIRAERDDVPVVFATGYDGDELGKALDEVQANALIRKPFRLEDLRRVVGSMICPFIGGHLFGSSEF